MARFFVNSNDITDSNIYLEKEQDVKHLVKVLRGKVGDKVDISDGGSWEYSTEIAEIYDGQVVLRILDKQKPAREPNTRVTLFQGIPKAQKMETIIQKTVELGVDSIVPVFMDRTVVVDKGNFDKKLSRWQKISDEAVKQCKRGMIPTIEKPIKSKDLEKALTGRFDLVICPYENEDDRSIKDLLRKYNDADKPKDVAIIIGPEGGFSEKEIENIVSSPVDGQLVTLGRTILRTETAGMAALAMVMYELEL